MTDRPSTDTAWLTTYLAVAMLTGRGVDDAVRSLGPELHADARRLAARFVKDDRTARARGLADAVATLVRSIEEGSLA
ncbi:MAG: hypothetical protein U0169_11220 [Polyangiaceae bacterium]